MLKPKPKPKQRQTPRRQRREDRKKISDVGFGEHPDLGWLPESEIRNPKFPIMFSSRNIHFALLGIILGAASGYVFAFYQVQTSMPAPAASAGSGNSSQNHPPVNNDQILALFKAALEKKPNEPELMTRYASFLANLGRYSEEVEWFQKVLTVQPNNLDARTDLDTALRKMGTA